MNHKRGPTCGKEFDAAETEAMPFCCERCRLIDLGRWLDEDQMVPVVSQAVLDEIENIDDAGTA